MLSFQSCGRRKEGGGRGGGRGRRNWGGIGREMEEGKGWRWEGSKDRSGKDGGGRGPSTREMKWGGGRE